MWSYSQGGLVKGISDKDRNENLRKSLSLGGGAPLASSPSLGVVSHSLVHLVSTCSVPGPT